MPPGDTLNDDESVEVGFASVPRVTIDPPQLTFTSDSKMLEVELVVDENAHAGAFILRIAETTLTEGRPDDRLLVDLPAAQLPEVTFEVRPVVDFILDLDEDTNIIADSFNEAVDKLALGAIATTLTTVGLVHILVSGAGAKTAIDATALLGNFSPSLGACVVHLSQPGDTVAPTVPSRCDILQRLADNPQIPLRSYRSVLYWVGLDADGKVATDSAGGLIELGDPRQIYIAPPVGFITGFWLYEVDEVNVGVGLPLEIGGIDISEFPEIGMEIEIGVRSGDSVLSRRTTSTTFRGGRIKYEYMTTDVPPTTSTEVQITELNGVAFYGGVSASQLDSSAKSLVANHELYSLGNDRITLVPQTGQLPVPSVDPLFPKDESKRIPLGGYYDVVVYRYSSETRAFEPLGEASSAREVVIEASTGRVTIEAFSRIPGQVREEVFTYPSTSSSIFEIVISTSTEVVAELADDTMKIRVFGVDKLPLLGRGPSSVTRVNGAGGPEAGPFAALADPNQLFADPSLFPDLSGRVSGVYDFVIGLAGGAFSPDGGLAAVSIEIADDQDVDDLSYYVYQQQPSGEWRWDIFYIQAGIDAEINGKPA